MTAHPTPVEEPNEVTRAAMEAAARGEDMIGPFDSVADLMAALEEGLNDERP